MDLGAGLDRDEDLRRYRRTRNWHLGICLVLTIASGVVVGGVVVGLADGSASPGEVNVIGGAAVLFVLLALPAVFTAVKAAYWNRLAKERLRETATATATGRTAPPARTWVPPGPGETAYRDLDLTAQVSRLGVPAWRAIGTTVVFLVLLAGGIVEGVRSSASGQELLDSGVRVTARVYFVTEPSKGSWTIDVTYPVGDAWRTAEIRLETKRDFDLGQEVPVIYDPEDPGRVRTPEDENTSDVQLSLFVEPLLAGLGGVPFAAWAAVGWVRRYRAVRRTGWHPASVLVTPTGQIFATYFQGGKIELGGVLSTRRATRFAHGERQRAWVGGEASTMVVLFPREGGKRPYAVPVQAETPLSPPRRSSRRRRSRGTSRTDEEKRGPG
ncbi:DUF3592 domain-containing protein [Amycolatopsis echigonensis]|uniref:DUF3592 domain-containing protein n=1 Tax=Amycolatopsis echigonensis TaxID=2576905 RepID=UPI0011784695|nr:DUF3592 domain-containing protein [Amycolatopsis niigatensis]